MQTLLKHYLHEQKPVKSKSGYLEALTRLDAIFDAKIGTPESDGADVLGLMIDEYEKNIIQLLHLTQFSRKEQILQKSVV